MALWHDLMIPFKRGVKGQAALEFLMQGNRKISGLKNSRGQAALEFLMTYGWATLIIFIMIGALVYFGVFNPSKITPERCSAEIGFECTEWDMTNSYINVRMVNHKGSNLKEVKLTNVNSLNFANPPTCNILNSTWSTDGYNQIECTGTNIFGGAQEDKAKISFTISYKLNRGIYTKEFDTDLFATVR